jgi:hypothetical protein
MAKVARAKSLEEISQVGILAGGSYRALIVTAFRTFYLKPTAQNAERLLSAIPTDEAQGTEIMTLGDSLCDHEAFADMLVLGQVTEKLPSELARAVLAAPRFMPAYVKYALIAVLDPHNDYAVQMRRVCQKKHDSFAVAIAGLSTPEQQRFNKYVMSVANCEVLSVPEAGR